MNKSDLIKIISETLGDEGFKKIKSMWYLESEECFAILELEKSPWGGQFSILLDVIVKQLDNSNVPEPINGNFISWELGQYQVDREIVKKNFDLEDDSIPLFERKAFIQEILKYRAMPFLKKVSTIEGIKHEIINNKMIRHHTMPKLWDFLNLEVERYPPVN
ncbi:DUF4304 domain-containing protein [Flavihumibacter solisilvae]|uniref:DUF4304 domain-containing protein n=1 Tax=Flavihumibacter solisilvae TaxID=1349421 RepID=A0A0C1L4D5_9BACT|nr:DUF4304 domain-containing protein [Flavihumibacter solisilvae]KIC94982.1 hypothetical protein OI18_08835 [Flavihumibacter solisilvae]